MSETRSTSGAGGTTDAPRRTIKKKPLDPHLVSGPEGTVDDVRVQTGYPLWNLIELWMVGHYNDATVFAGYEDLPPEEWEAAKRYYREHKPFIDARILANSQPAADDDIPAIQSVDEYFAYLAQHDQPDQDTPANAPHGAPMSHGPHRAR